MSNIYYVLYVYIYTYIYIDIYMFMYRHTHTYSSKSLGNLWIFEIIFLFFEMKYKNICLVNSIYIHIRNINKNEKLFNCYPPFLYHRNLNKLINNISVFTKHVYFKCNFTLKISWIITLIQK